MITRRKPYCLTWRSALLGSTMVLFSVSAVRGDVLHLKNGQELEGRVMSETDSSIVFQDMRRVVLTLNKENIARIDKSPSALNYEDLGDDAAKREDFAQALKHYELALENGGEARRLNQKIAEARRAIDSREIGRYAEDVQNINQMIQNGSLREAEAAIAGLSEKGAGDQELFTHLNKLRSDLAYQKALHLLDSVNYVEAEEALFQALSLNPQNARACLELAKLSSQINKTREEAIHYYKEALRHAEGNLTPDEILHGKYSLGLLYKGAGRNRDATEYLQQVYDTNPQFRPSLQDELVTSLNSLAEEIKKRNPTESADCLRRALSVRPYDAKLRVALAQNLIAMEKVAEAIEEYEIVLEAQPTFPHINQYLGNAYREKGETENALEYFERELTFDAENYDAMISAGDLLVRMGDYDRAEQYFLQARSLDPTEPRATVALATIQRLLGNYGEARKYVQEILAIRPDDPRTNLELGLINKDEKIFTEATKALDHTISLIEEGDRESLERYRELLADAYIARGEIKLLTKGPATATEDFNQALEHYPDYGAAYYNVGAAYQKKYNISKNMEDLQKAREHMMKARELDPENPEFAYGLGVLYHQVLASAEPEKEKEYLREALANYKDYLKHGGADVTKVEGIIEELENTV